ncbi:MAG TPA: integrase domain-containing protein [Cellvibrio sp.]|nr:integrase domain-containing protein [Cellvibrio sp.]
MARVTKPLNDTQIKNAKPKAKEYNLADGQGLALRVKPNATKQWLFNYEKPYTKARTNISFGTYPETTLEQARQKRKDARSLLAQAIDPKEHRDQIQSAQEEAHSLTLEHVATRWFDVKKSKVSPDYADDIWRSLTLHIFPTLGKLPIHKITAPKAIKTLEPIAAKGSLETIKRLCQRINEIMVHALNVGLIPSNPLAGIHSEFKKPTKTNMPTLTPGELPELMRTINQASIKRLTRCLIEWQLHTMVRPSEAAGARWNEINIETALWTIPAERMKRKRIHIVPLSPQALAILDVLRPISGHREYLFTNQNDYDKSTSPQTANMALKRMGFAGRLVAHGMRSLASTTLNEQRFDKEIIEAALSHADENQVRSAYNRSDYLEQRRVLMKWWSDHIEQASTGNLSVAHGIKALRAVR